MKQFNRESTMKHNIVEILANSYRKFELIWH